MLVSARLPSTISSVHMSCRVIECVCVCECTCGRSQSCVYFHCGSRSGLVNVHRRCVFFFFVLPVGEVMYNRIAELQGYRGGTNNSRDSNGAGQARCCCGVIVWPPTLSGRISSTQRMLGRSVCREAGCARNKH